MSSDLRSLLVRHAEGRTDLEGYTYLQPMPGGLYLVYDACRGIPIKVASVAGGVTFAPGQAVLVGQRQGSQEKAILGLPPPGTKGVSVFSHFSPPGTTFDTVVIVSATPDEIAPGATVNTSLFGGPFVESPLDLFDPVNWDEPTQTYVADSEVTLGLPTWISDNEVTLDVSVDSGAAVGKLISIRVRRA